jgi:hypothetical protein
MEIKACLGHASITTTLNTYGHLFPSVEERLRSDSPSGWTKWRVMPPVCRLWAARKWSPGRRGTGKTASGLQLRVVEVRGVEPLTSAVRRQRSTTELHPRG